MEKQTKTGFRRTTGKLTAWLLTGALLLSSGVCPDVSAAGKVMIKNMPAVKYMPAGSSFLVKANQKNAKLSFTSSKKKIASVDKSGLILAKKKGTTKLKVSSGKKSAKVTIKVVPSKGFTMSKKAGVYQESVTTTLKAQKGYQVYYTTSDKFAQKTKVKAGTSKKFTFTKTTTLKVYPVRTNQKMTTAKLNKTAGTNRNRGDYCYQIKAAGATNVPTGTAVSAPTAIVASPLPTTVPATTPTAPVTSDKPAVSQTPDVSVKPDATTTPFVTNPPVETDPVVTTPEPIDSKEPAVTDIPETSDTPDATDNPAHSSEPTEKPVNILQPGEEGYCGDAADGYVIAYKGTFEESDSNVSIDNAVQITLPKTAAKQEFKDSDGNVVASLSKKNKLSITKPGTYLISSEGSASGDAVAATIEVSYDADAAAAASQELHMILDGVRLASAPSKTDNGVITIKNGDTDISKAIITVLGENVIEDQGAADLNLDDHTAGIMSKKNVPLTLNGSGSLQISSENGNGIQCKNFLKLQDATIKVTTGNAEDASVGNNGISGKTGLFVKNADLTIDAAGDALKTTLDAADIEADPALAELGNMSIDGGKYQLTARNGDGISAFRTLYLNPDEMTVTAQNKAGKDLTAAGSCKAVKAGTTLYVSPDSGSITADNSQTAGNGELTADDALCSDGYICINGGGDLTIKPGKSALRAVKGILFNGHLEDTLNVEDYKTLF